MTTRSSRSGPNTNNRFYLLTAVALLVGVWRVFSLHLSLFDSSKDPVDATNVVAGLLPHPRRSRHVLPQLENCTAVYQNVNKEQDQTSTTSQHHHSCALLFFGLAKHFRHFVYPSIKDNILRVNPHRDIFAHTYNISQLHSHRNQERGAVIDPTEIYQLTSFVEMETIAEFERQHNMTHLMQERFRVAAKHGWEPQSYTNMLRQWHSIQQVWKLMQRHEENHNKQYQRVALFRSDVLYSVPINIAEGNAVIPAFGKMTNDRMFYGLYENAFVWSNMRFPSVDCYVPPLPTHGLHSEHFMRTLILPNIPNWTRRYDICFYG